MRPSSPTPQGLQSVRHPSKFHPRKERIRGTIQVRRSFQNGGFLAGLSLKYGHTQPVKPNKRNDWSFSWFSKTPFVWSFPIRQEIYNISQIGIAVDGICPPFFIQTWLQQYSRGAFLYSAYCSFSNPICFRSVWCRRTVSAGELFTSFAEFQGIVSVNDFRIPIGLQELLQASLGFL